MDHTDRSDPAAAPPFSAGSAWRGRVSPVRARYLASVGLPDRLPTDPKAPRASTIDAAPGVDHAAERQLDVQLSIDSHLGVHGELRAYAQSRLDAELAAIAAIDAQLDALVAARRDAVRLVRRYHRTMWRRSEHVHHFVRPFPAATLRPPGGEMLAGADLRAACRHEVLLAAGPCSVAEVRTALLARGCDAAPVGRGPCPQAKAIAGVLDREVRAGRLRRIARGIYAPP